MSAPSYRFINRALPAMVRQERGKNNDSDGGRRPIGTRARKPVGKVVVPKAHSRRMGCHLLVLPSSSFPLSPRECLRKAGAAADGG